MKVALVQLAYGDDEPVADRVERAAELVRAQRGHDLVVLPELWAPGGFSYKLWNRRAETLDGPIATAMSAAARDAGVVLHAGSIVEQVAPGGDPGPQGRGRWNTSLVFGADGGLLASYRKVHRFGFGEGEPQLLEAGGEIVTADVPRPDAGDTDPAVERSTPHLSGAVTVPYPLSPLPYRVSALSDPVKERGQGEGVGGRARGLFQASQTRRSWSPGLARHGGPLVPRRSRRHKLPLTIP